MKLADGVEEVRNQIGEINPWLFSDIDIVRYLNLSANNLCCKAQALRTTYASKTSAPITLANGSLQGVQEYAMPLDVEDIIQVKVQIGLLLPIVFSSQENLQIGAYVTALPLSGYVRYGIIQTGMVPSAYDNAESFTEEVLSPPPDTTGVPRWWVGFYPIPAAVYPFYVDYYQQHPQMTQPEDYVRFPSSSSDLFEAWIAYAIAKCMAKMGDLTQYNTYMDIHNKGCEAFKTEMLIKNVNINPPEYGGTRGNPLFNRSPSVLVIPPASGIQIGAS